MTRLKTADIDSISDNLDRYDAELMKKTGHSLLGVACHACGRKISDIIPLIQGFAVGVVPVTAGQGIITTFSHTVASIVAHLGFAVTVTGETDTSGVAEAFEKKVHGIMMSDDNRFVALHLAHQRVIDNSRCTGRGYAAGLDLMVGGVKEKRVGVVGCGPVGSAAARWLLDAGARVVLLDIVPDTAERVRSLLLNTCGHDSRGIDARVSVADGDLVTSLSQLNYILDATPVEHSVPDNALSEFTFVAAPGVPLGVSEKGSKEISSRLIHDKLEIGVATMAVSML